MKLIVIALMAVAIMATCGGCVGETLNLPHGEGNGESL